MANVTVANYSLASANEHFNGIWKLTRAMLAAGWRYKGSGDATAGGTKDTSADAMNDKWALDGAVNTTSVRSSNSCSIAAASGGLSTITGLASMVANDVGRFLVISGAATAANNGSFRIVSRTSGTQVAIFNPGAVSDANNGTASLAYDVRGGGSAASIAVAVNGRSTLTGLSGMTASSVGHRLTIIGAATGANNGTFLITDYIGLTSVKIENSLAVSDANNGSIVWTEVDPLQQTCPSSLAAGSGAGAWLNLQGPSTLKVPIGANSPTGTFLRGENVVQSTTGATGELLGVVTDAATSLGFLVIAPRLSGNGAGPRGWHFGGGHDITGGFSGAVMSGASISAQVIEFVREIVFWKNTSALGHIYAQCVDQSAETASRFSVLAAGGSVSNTVCPGGPTGTFPSAGSQVLTGTGGANTAATTSNNWIGSSNSGNNATLGAVQIMCANGINNTGVSADGSFTILYGCPAQSPGAFLGFGFLAMDASEDGDVDPYVYAFQNGTNYAGSRTANVATNSSNDQFSFTVAGSFFVSSSTPVSGFRRRGFSSGDAYQQYNMCSLAPVGVATAILATTNGSPDRVACNPNTQVFVREPIWVISTQSGQRQRKGSIRWWYGVQGGNSCDTYSSGLYMQAGFGTTGAYVIGPWDGSTFPRNV